jgi:ABC-type methionine transport system ATPase subunit
MAIKTKKTSEKDIREQIYLTFPKKLINQPVLSLLAKQFDVVFNIRSSTVTANMALVAIDLVGKAPEVAKAMRWLKTKGVDIEAIPRNVID